MSQNREMFLMDHNPASVNTPENVQDHELVVGADFDKPR
jgi:hypothetical protein